MKKVKKNPSRRLSCNLLQAEVYVRYPVCLIEDKPVKKYCELQERPCANGVIEEYVSVDYPITADSVNSFVDTADYKRNPDVFANAVPRQNLGDVSEIQKVLSNDMTALREMLAHGKDVLAKAEAIQKQNNTSAAGNSSVENSVKSEEVNNG